MRYGRLVLLVLVWLGTTGFGFPNNYAPARRMRPDLKPGQGRILISTGAPSPCATLKTEIVVQRLPQNLLTYQELRVDDWLAETEFPDHTGFLSGMTLKAGDYEIYASIENPYRPESSQRYVFSLAAGESLYLGQYWQALNCRPWMSGASGGFSDQRERDLALLRAQNPKMADVVFTTRIPAPFGIWPEDGNKMWDKTSPPQPELTDPGPMIWADKIATPNAEDPKSMEERLRSRMNGGAPPPAPKP